MKYEYDFTSHGGAGIKFLKANSFTHVFVQIFTITKKLILNDLVDSET